MSNNKTCPAELSDDQCGRTGAPTSHKITFLLKTTDFRAHRIAPITHYIVICGLFVGSGNQSLWIKT